MGTTTTNYSLNKPTVGGDDDAWGGLINTSMDTIDTQMKANADAAAAAVQDSDIGVTVQAYDADTAKTDVAQTFTADQSHGDNVKAKFGAGDDLQIYHSGSHSLIKEIGTGNLYLQASDLRIQSATGESYIECDQDSGVAIKYDNATKFKTTSTGVDVTGNVSLPDNGKATFGASDDLEIYHDGSNSYIKDGGTGTLRIQGSSSILLQKTDGEIMLIAREDGAVETYHNGSKKLATTSTGVDVTGTVSADGLTVDGDVSTGGALLAGEYAHLDVGYITGTAYPAARISGYRASGNFSSELTLSTMTTTGAVTPRLNVDGGGDISFYEDTGTTPKFFWDASTERLGIGTTNPLEPLHITDADPKIRLQNSGAGDKRLEISIDVNAVAHISAPQSASQIAFETTGSERARIDSSGNLLVGMSSPSTSVDGVYLRVGSDSGFNASNTNVLSLNRRSSDGQIVQFKKDGSTVGSIGSASFSGSSVSRPYFTNHSSDGLGIHYINSTNAAIVPIRGNTEVDDAGYLGDENHRWKDLYLSGGVYLGGTASANKLDDYEEGTWTPSLGWASQTAAPTVLSFENAKYVKIGKLVQITCYFVVTDSGSGSTGFSLSGLPFTGDGNYQMTPIWNSNTASPMGMYLPNGSSALRIALLAGGSANLSSSDDAIGEYSVQFTYLTTQ